MTEAKKKEEEERAEICRRERGRDCKEEGRRKRRG